MKKVLIIVLAFLIMAVIATGYFTDETQWVGVRRTGETNDSVIPVYSPSNTTLSVNITNYGFKEWTTAIIASNYSLPYTNVSDISFNSLLEHLIIQPNTTTVKWRFKLTDSGGYIIYDGTDIDQTGRLGLIVDLPLIGIINFTIQNSTENATFRIKTIYT